MATLPAARRSRRAAWRGAAVRLLWFEPFWIAALAPALLFPGRFWVTSLQPVLVLLLFAFWPLRLLVSRRALRRSPLDLPLLALLAAVGMALALSPAPPSSWEAAGLLLLGVAAAGALIQWPPLQARPARAAWLLLAAGGAIAVLGPLLLGPQGDKLGWGALLHTGSSLAPALGEAINPNVLGGALLAPTLLALALATGPRWEPGGWRYVWAVLAVAAAAELAFTECRGALLGLAAGALLLLLLRWPGSGWLLVPVSALGLALLFLGGALDLAFDAIGAGSGLAGRLAIWQAAATALQQQPLTGLGLGLFAPWVIQHGLLVTTAEVQLHAHNLLLQVAADLGVLGLAAYLALWLAAAAMLAVLLRNRPNGTRPNDGRLSGGQSRSGPSPAQGGRVPIAAQHRRRLHWTLAAGSAAAGAGILVHGLVDATLWGNKVAFIPWLLLALICLLFLDAAQEQPDP